MWPIVWFVVLFLFGFVMIAALYAAAAALVSRTEDLNTALQPLTWLVMLPYLGIAVGNSNPLAMTVMSYIPFSAPVAVPVRIFLGQSAGWEPFASLALLVLTTVVRGPDLRPRPAAHRQTPEVAGGPHCCLVTFPAEGAVDRTQPGRQPRCRVSAVPPSTLPRRSGR